MKHLVFLLEELSAKAMLDKLLPQLIPEIDYRCMTFEGKQDLEKNIVKKIRNYRRPNSHFIILRDQDSGDCIKIKQNLVKLCETANRADTLVRIACRELESWYLADLHAVEKGLGISGIAKRQNNKKYRYPDRLECPSKILENLTKGQYQKISGSRKIGSHLDLSNTRSNSFRVFIEGIKTVS